jgi:hypothetical protein
MHIYDNISLNYFGMRNVLDRSCRENQNSRFMFNNVSENSAVYENVKKIWYARKKR